MVTLSTRNSALSQKRPLVGATGSAQGTKNEKESNFQDEDFQNACMDK